MNGKRLLQFLGALVVLSLASGASAQSLKVQFRPTWIAVNDNQIALVLNVVNTGSTTVALSTVTVRYYFTKEGSASASSWCDYTPRGCSNVSGSFGTVNPPTATADSYFQLAFSSGAGSLSPGQSTGDIQIRIAKSDWSAFNEANDYSYAGNSGLTDSPNITAFVSGALVWGTAPPPGGTSDFALTASPASVSVAQSGTASSTIAIARTSFTSAVTFTASGLPAGVTASFSPASATGASSAVTFTASSTATVGGPTVVTLTGTGGSPSLTRTAQVTLTVTGGPTQDFSLSASPSTLTVAPGSSAVSTLAIARTNFPSSVAFSASGLPAGVTATFTPTSTTGTSANVTFAASSSAAAGGPTPIILSATGGSPSITRTVQVNLTVGVSQPDFTLTASPTTVSVTQGSSATSTIAITRSNFTSAVAFTATGLPSGVTATFNPTSATGNSATVTFAASSTAAAGSTLVTLTGTGGSPSIVRTVPVTVSVGGTCAGGNCGWRVANGRVTHNGTLFQFHCGSWFGLQGRYEIASDSANPRGAPMEQYIGNTFWANGGKGTGRTIAGDFAEMKNAGITVIRLPVVHQTLDKTDPQGTKYLKNHSSVSIPDSRTALETMLREADKAGVYVLLDIHSCSNYVDWRKGRLDARPPWVDANRQNYDYKREDCSCADDNNPPSVTRKQPYNETLWIQDLKVLAKMNQDLGVKSVLGIDIYNEPWDYSWSEWKTLIEHAYQAIDSVDSSLLIFAQGISASHGNQLGVGSTPVATPHGTINPNWGENLYEAGDDPPNVPKERLVYSPHAYGPSVAVQPQFLDPAQTQCAGLQEGDAAAARCNIVINPTLIKQGWDEHFGYLKDRGYAVIVGEWGGNLLWPKGKASTRDQQLWSYLPTASPGVDEQWQNAFTDYMVSKGIESCYWSINPESGDTLGWYDTPYDPATNTGGWGEWSSFVPARTALLNKVWNGIK